MKPRISRFALAGLLILAAASGAMAQNPPKPLVPLKVQVVIARYEGDKKVSSMPYTMSVTANNARVSLRMGSQIPVPTTSYQGAGNSTPVTSYNYHNVGTNIDCSATTTDDGRYSVFVGIEDSSVVERRANDAIPTLRNFSTQNTVVLRDGQTMQFTAAADKTTGEVVKVDVTLTVEK
jgi:hypothetical protein